MSKNVIIAGVAVVVILAIAAGGFVLFQNRENLPTENLETEDSSNSTTQQTPNNSMMNKGQMMVTYKDGIYSATGIYSTPGGTEQIGVKITLKNGVITDSQVAQQGKSPTAKVKQADFAANYKPFVIGKNINEVNLTVVSGSSLTPQAFDEALSQIKSQAKS